jgi:glycosyltransferase involved in cell wall biosynthesis
MPIKISAVICTHNRADYLRRALASLVEPGLADEQEVLVVENASTDATQQVVSSSIYR